MGRKRPARTGNPNLRQQKHIPAPPIGEIEQEIFSLLSPRNFKPLKLYKNEDKKKFRDRILSLFKFPWFDPFTQANKFFVTRLREKTSYKVIRCLANAPFYRDEIIDMGEYRSNPCQRQVRLISVLWGSNWYYYLTNVLDPQILSAQQNLRKMFYFPAEYFPQLYSLPLIPEVRFQKDYFSEYPEQIRNRTSLSYTRKHGYYAVQYNQPNTMPPGAILQLNDGAMSMTGYAYAIFPGEPNQSEQGTVSPIYTLQPNGSVAVPTGLVFIRFAEGVDVESQREVINRAGYEIVQSLDYAPHTAWLRAQSGNIADAIARIPQLEAIPKVENIEPQMLMERGLRLGR